MLHANMITRAPPAAHYRPFATTVYTTFTIFSMKYLLVCMVYTDDGGIK